MIFIPDLYHRNYSNAVLITVERYGTNTTTSSPCRLVLASPGTPSISMAATSTGSSLVFFDRIVVACIFKLRYVYCNIYDANWKFADAAT